MHEMPHLCYRPRYYQSTPPPPSLLRGTQVEMGVAWSCRVDGVVVPGGIVKLCQIVGWDVWRFFAFCGVWVVFWLWFVFGLFWDSFVEKSNLDF